VTADADAVIIGAGPAGSAAATLLAGRGFRTVVLEAKTFPRRKVCGAFLSAQAWSLLETLGAAAEVERAGPERISGGFLNLPSGLSVAFALPAPGLGLSRSRFDQLLAEGAARAGAIFRFGTRVTGLERVPGGFRVPVSNGQAVTARVAIGAWGRWDALDRSLDRSLPVPRSRYFGWSGEYEGDGARLKGSVRLYAFDGGYCGLSRVEGGTVNLAGIIAGAAQHRLAPGWENVVAHALRSNRRLAADLEGLSPAGFLGTGPVFFAARSPVEKGILLAGDAAGVLDPFSGQGQAAALSSGALAAECAGAFLSGRVAEEELARLYLSTWRERFRRQFACSAAFRRFLLSPRLGSVAGRIAGPRLTRLAVTALAGPHSERPAAL
jgi:flavin-dependent dehydrogenase